MLMVIFGAGASYDSSPDKPAGKVDNMYRPPLADNLFVDTEVFRQFRLQFPQFLDIVPQLLPRPSRSVEEALQRLQDDEPRNRKRRVQLTAVRYYLQGLFSFLSPNWLSATGGVTNYEALIEQIENHRKDDEPVCLVTFNYDTLLESALSRQFGASFDVIANYISHPQFKLFKLHGSANWGRTIQAAPEQVHRGGVTEIIQYAADLGLSDRIVTASSYAGSPQLYPAIAIPVTNKDTFECPSDAVHQLEQLIPSITRVVTIGWRASEQHFLAMLRKLGSVRVAAIAGTETDAQETFNQIRALGIGIADYALFAGFTEAIVQRRLDGILAF